MVLSGNVYLKKLEADLSVNVIYEVVSSQLVSKRIELQQNNLSLLYYSVGTSITAADKPSTFWSFDDNENMGGVAHETYPAAGYMLNDTLAVGLLTDAGDKNLWTRNIRRRPSKQGKSVLERYAKFVMLILSGLPMKDSVKRRLFREIHFR